MPHLIITYTGQLDAETDMRALCRQLAHTLRTVPDDAGKPAFPTGGIRVLAYPSAHHAVADDGAAGAAASGQDDYAFMYLNLRMGKGRSPATQQRAGDAIAQTTHAHMAGVMAKRYLGITVQVDVGQEAYDNKHSNIHPLFTNQ
jgi:5-carboxymethyl-2-hydroxymuconate isomerase